MRVWGVALETDSPPPHPGLKFQLPHSIVILGKLLHFSVPVSYLE